MSVLVSVLVLVAGLVSVLVLLSVSVHRYGLGFSWILDFVLFCYVLFGAVFTKSYKNVSCEYDRLNG